MNRSQAKNIQKYLTLARATTGDESEKHYAKVEELIAKYNVYIPTEVNYPEAVTKALDGAREHRLNVYGKKADRRVVFYKHNELWGWRFYLKAITHFDLQSIFTHIKRTYFK